jgi:hypothetical protein
LWVIVKNIYGYDCLFKGLHSICYFIPYFTGFHTEQCPNTLPPSSYNLAYLSIYFTPDRSEISVRNANSYLHGFLDTFIAFFLFWRLYGAFLASLWHLKICLVPFLVIPICSKIFKLTNSVKFRVAVQLEVSQAT